MTTGKINQIARQIDGSREPRRRPRAEGRSPSRGRWQSTTRHRVAQAKDDAPTGHRVADRRGGRRSDRRDGQTGRPAVAGRPTDERAPSRKNHHLSLEKGWVSGSPRAARQPTHFAVRGSESRSRRKARAALARAPETTADATATRRASARRHNNCQGREPGDPEAGLLPRWPEAHRAAGGFDSRESRPRPSPEPPESVHKRSREKGRRRAREFPREPLPTGRREARRRRGKRAPSESRRASPSQPSVSEPVAVRPKALAVQQKFPTRRSFLPNRESRAETPMTQKVPTVSR